MHQISIYGRINKSIIYIYFMIEDIEYTACNKCNWFPENWHCEYCWLFLDAEDPIPLVPSVVGTKVISTLEDEKNTLNKIFLFGLFESYRIEISPDWKIYCVNFYFNWRKYMIKWISYTLSENDIFWQRRIENLKNEWLFPKVKNWYWEKIISLKWEYLSNDELKNYFLLRWLKRFIMELILDFHTINKKLAK